MADERNKVRKKIGINRKRKKQKTSTINGYEE
jgi:hypothetical protein